MSISDRIPIIMDLNTYSQLFLLFLMKYTLIPIVILMGKLKGNDRMIVF